MKIASLVLLCSTAFAQSPTPPATGNITPNQITGAAGAFSPPQLTHTEQIALQTLVQQFQEQVELINRDIKVAHPGYELDKRTLQLEPIAKAPAKPEPKK